MEAKLKEFIKEAVYEALVDFSEAAVATTDVITSTSTDKKKDEKPGRPGPVIGPVGFSL